MVRAALFRLVRQALMAFGLLMLFPLAAHADRRVALLIGNAEYEATAPLRNPPNDVALMKKAFETAGFDAVDMVNNADRRGMINALRAFEDKAVGADIAVIYYSGHGLELGGDNYLVPVDARLASDRDVGDEAVTLDRVQRSMDGVKRLRLVILDACRNNPFESTMHRSGGTKAVTRGLSRVEPASDTLVAFAAKAGTVAEDGSGQNSPFAAALAKRLVEPGLDVQIAFRKIRDDVLDATGHKQEPYLYGSIGGSELPLSKVVVPVEPVKPPEQVATVSPIPAPAPESDDAEAARAFDAVKSLKSAAALQAFIDHYPTSFYASLAKGLLADLQTVKPAPAPAPEPPVVPSSDDDSAWQAVKDAKDAQLIRDFLLRFPRSSHVAEAKALLALITRRPDPPKVVVDNSSKSAPPKKIAPKPVAQKAPVAKSSGGGNCFSFNGKQICE